MGKPPQRPGTEEAPASPEETQHADALLDAILEGGVRRVHYMSLRGSFGSHMLRQQNAQILNIKKEGLVMERAR